MMQATVIRHQKPLSPEISHKLAASRKAATMLKLRDIHCPYCNFLVEKVFSDATGHKMVYCRKCKMEYPINLGCFRKMKITRSARLRIAQRTRQKR